MKTLTKKLFMLAIVFQAQLSLAGAGSHGGFKELNEFLTISKRLQEYLKYTYDFNKLFETRIVNNVVYHPLTVIPGENIICGEFEGTGYTACSEETLREDGSIQYITTLNKQDWQSYTCEEQYALTLHEMFTFIGIEKTGDQKLSSEIIAKLDKNDINCTKEKIKPNMLVKTRTNKGLIRINDNLISVESPTNVNFLVNVEFDRLGNTKKIHKTSKISPVNRMGNWKDEKVSNLRLTFKRKNPAGFFNGAVKVIQNSCSTDYIILSDDMGLEFSDGRKTFFGLMQLGGITEKTIEKLYSSSSFKKFYDQKNGELIKLVSREHQVDHCDYQIKDWTFAPGYKVISSTVKGFHHFQYSKNEDFIYLNTNSQHTRLTLRGKVIDIEGRVILSVSSSENTSNRNRNYIMCNERESQSCFVKMDQQTIEIFGGKGISSDFLVKN